MRSVILAVLIGLTACAAPVTATPLPLQPTPSLPAAPTEIILPSSPVPATAAPDDLFSLNGIELPAPVCDGIFTPAQTEGPYYKPNTPERNSLLGIGLTGTRLILVGYVLDQNCQPIPGAWLDFWQADANGVYDNQGYTLRGHQFTDAQGRYYLETVIPGEYPDRPIAHIHVKVQPPNGDIRTSQLYFPSEPVNHLTVVLEDRGKYSVAYFNFVVAR